jgi:octaprenyl-diphosphate synthase
MSAIKTPASLPNIQEIQTTAANEMAAVNALIRLRLGSEVVLINQISEHIIAAGGKRLRPVLAAVSARALSYQGQAHTKLATIIEFIHTATLLHDDVVDESNLRRGRKTANALWGNAPSVLVGDFLYSRAFQLMVELNDMTIQSVLADATNAIAEGEVLQLLHVHNPDTDEAAYLRVIERKTAVLFSAATRLGALIAGVDTAMQEKMADYGMNLGMAFQIADDVLDYTSDAETLGKNLGDDLAEGKATLPLIHALSLADTEQTKVLRHIIETGDNAALSTVIQAIEQHGSVAYSHACAVRYAEKAEQALADVPDSEWKQVMLGLSRYAIERTY